MASFIHVTRLNNGKFEAFILRPRYKAHNNKNLGKFGFTDQNKKTKITEVTEAHCFKNTPASGHNVS
jgi:hypothetical protein